MSNNDVTAKCQFIIKCKHVHYNNTIVRVGVTRWSGTYRGGSGRMLRTEGLDSTPLSLLAEDWVAELLIFSHRGVPGDPGSGVWEDKRSAFRLINTLWLAALCCCWRLNAPLVRSACEWAWEGVEGWSGGSRAGGLRWHDWERCTSSWGRRLKKQVKLWKPHTSVGVET